MHPRHCILALITLASTVLTVPDARASGDFDDDGYVGLTDYWYYEICLSISGPGHAVGYQECIDTFDADADGDVDLADFAAFQRARGHLPMPLKDTLGNVIHINSTRPYSGRHTCGECHNLNTVTNGFLFQQGRTDTDGNLIMQDDFYGDGRWWIKSSGRYGKWGQTFKFLLAAKENANESEIDQTAFAWIRDCSSCHPGGGPGEFDRDGQLLYD
ncbi:MAG: hypothetical protein WBE26_17370, partial [Phycisphaerae bacterium]